MDNNFDTTPVNIVNTRQVDGTALVRAQYLAFGQGGMHAARKGVCSKPTRRREEGERHTPYMVGRLLEP